MSDCDKHNTLIKGKNWLTNTPTHAAGKEIRMLNGDTGGHVNFDGRCKV